MGTQKNEVELRSPLKDISLPQAGDSTQRRINDLADDGFVSYAMGALFVCIIAAMEWFKWLVPQKPSPVLYTVLAGLAVSFATVQFFRIRKKLRRLRQGWEGERAVGQFLERLRESGGQVFHDIPGKNFNVDHVLIHPTGIYSLETKTYSKPAKGDARITFDGNAVSLLGKAPNPKPVVQARAAASWLRGQLKESTAKDFAVRPVVLFPGWYVENSFGGGKSDTWVLEPKALASVIGQQQPVLSQSDISLAAFHLSRYCRMEVGSTRRR